MQNNKNSICPKCQAEVKAEYDSKKKCGEGHVFLASRWDKWNKENPDAKAAVRRKGWRTPHGFIDFEEPVTYEEACEISALFREELAERLGQL